MNRLPFASVDGAEHAATEFHASHGTSATRRALESYDNGQRRTAGKGDERPKFGGSFRSNFDNALLLCRPFGDGEPAVPFPAD